MTDFRNPTPLSSGGVDWIVDGLGDDPALMTDMDSNRAGRVEIHTAVILFGLCVCEILSGVIVLPVFLKCALLRRHRLRLRKCLACGHRLDPKRTQHRCPECGVETERDSPQGNAQRRRPGFVTLAIASHVLLLIAWVLMSLIMISPYYDLTDRYPAWETRRVGRRYLVVDVL